MRLYAIHAPTGAATEDIRAARTGFSFAALIFGPLWLLARGLWLALAAYVAAAVLIFALARFGYLKPEAVLAFAALGHFYLAIEGRRLKLASWERAGWPLVDVVHAHSALEAERIGLERAFTAPTVAARREAGAGGDVIGLFPEGGR